MPSESVRVTGPKVGEPVSPRGVSYVVLVIADMSRGTGDEDILGSLIKWYEDKTRPTGHSEAPCRAGSREAWAPWPAKTAYDVGRTIYSVGQAIAPYAGAALALV